MCQRPALPACESDAGDRWHVRLGLVFFAAVALGSSWFNLVLLGAGPLGWAIELALLFWVFYVDDVAFNGRGRPILAMRRGWWWDAFRSYFSMSLHQEDAFDASKRYVFAIHPHGVFGCSAWLSFAADTAGISRKNHNLDIGLATIKMNFLIPIWRDILLAVGFIDASFQSLVGALKAKRSVAVVVGGAAEALDSHPGTNNIILNKRKGFLRLALVTGTPIVPVFVFGESELYYQISNPRGSRLRKVQDKFLSLFKFSPPIIFGVGVWGCPVGILPRAVPLHVVTGTPLAVPLNPVPTDDDVLRLQRTYRAALEKLYADHAPRYYEQILPEHMRPTQQPVLRIIA